MDRKNSINRNTTIIGLLALLICGQVHAQDQKNTKNPAIPPQFLGGQSAYTSFLTTRLKPITDSLSNINENGKVLVFFKVDSTGALSDFRVRETFSPEVGDKVLEVFKEMPPWIPGMINGKAVNWVIATPVVFDSKSSGRKRTRGN